MAPEDELPEELEDEYDPEEVFKIDGTPEELAEALFKRDPADD